MYLPNKDDRSFQLLGLVAAGWVAGGWVILVVGVGPRKCTRVTFWDRLRSCVDVHDNLRNLLKNWPWWGPKKRFCTRLVLIIPSRAAFNYLSIYRCYDIYVRKTFFFYIYFTFHPHHPFTYTTLRGRFLFLFLFLFFFFPLFEDSFFSD